ncbi:MAG: zinc-binding dehydrogenase [Alphaproteobacteria bacterium]|jgi:putative PIG3 family NAD(P)H quinone oxidoreductase|nr:zinc-binding dehydrogenase [Alphaproteobacteria bacterium]
MATALPSLMTAVEIAEPGGPEVLRPIQTPVPMVAPGQVLIKVAAAGVNRPDVLQRMGKYAPPPDASPLPGLEVAGTVAAVGDAVERWKPGDRVCALVPGGGYAEYVVTPAPQVLPIPGTLSMVEAGGVPETHFTVWTNVFERGGLKKGEALLVHGGSSGIGTTAIQLAHQLGARVFATAGTEAKCEACEALGAERAIDYKTDDFVEVVLKATEGRGVDVVLDMIGGAYVPRNLEALAVEGRHVTIAVLGGATVTFNIQKMMAKRQTLTGSTLRPQSIEAKARIAKGLEDVVWPLLAAGTVKPIIHETFPLAGAAEAHALMESSAHIGKIVLTVD